MMEMKDLIVGRRPNATATYTEVEPETEEPLGGLAGVRQKGGRWRRITLVCVAMLIVIGVPLFVFSVVKSKANCSWDYYERPELIELPSPTDGTPMALVFYTMTDISDEVCSTWRFSYEETREDSYLFFTLLQFSSKNEWEVVVHPHNISGVLSQHAYIQASAVVAGNPILLLEEYCPLAASHPHIRSWYTGVWSLVTVTNWISANPTFNITHTTQVPEDLNFVYALQTLSDGAAPSTAIGVDSLAGTVILLRENQQENTSDADAKPLHLAKLPSSDPFGVADCAVDLLPTQDHPTYWWSIGVIGDQQYLYAGYDQIIRAANGSTVTPVYSYCQLDLGNADKCCEPKTPPWGKNTDAIYWDSATSLVLLRPYDSSECLWYNMSSKTTPFAVTEDWALQYCSTGASARRVGGDGLTWQQPDMKNHVLQRFNAPDLLGDNLDVLCPQSTEQATWSVVSSVVSVSLGTPTQLLVWVARPLPEEGKMEILSNWMAFQGLTQQQHDPPLGELLQCPCLPDFDTHQCPL